MINFFYETNFSLNQEQKFSEWIQNVIYSEERELGEVSYIFCDDDYLHKINVEFLNHDTLTDIISFDNTMGNELAGEIYISIERVRENAAKYRIEFLSELKRVMIHGVLHFCGYKDKTEDDIMVMRSKEDEAIDMY